MARRARERLIASAVELIRRNGVAATGIAELAAHSNTARRTIYLNFPGGKDELLAEATRSAGESIDAAIDDATVKDDPVAAIDGFITVWKQALVASDFKAGCPIAAAALAREVAPTLPAVAADSFAHWRSKLSRQLSGEGQNSAVAQSLATTIIAAVEGAVIMSLAGRSVQPLDDIRPHLAGLVGPPPKNRSAHTRHR